MHRMIRQQQGAEAVQSDEELNKLDNCFEQAKKNHNPQTQSPLFSVFPAEIRNTIFELAVSEYEDKNQPYRRESYYWRPGFHGKRRVDLALLRTCKLVWLETRPLPLKHLAESPFYHFTCNTDRSPPEYYGRKLVQLRRTKLFTYRQWEAIKTMHVFLQGLTIDNLRGILGGHCPINPTTLVLTTRYTDWLWWENQEPFSLDDTVMRDWKFPPSVGKVIMEFETIASREGELDALLNKVFREPRRYYWHGQSCEAGHLVTPFYVAHLEDPWRYVERWTWQGPTRYYANKSFAHHPPGDTMEYVVKAVTWLPRSLGGDLRSSAPISAPYTAGYVERNFGAKSYASRYLMESE